LASPVEPGPTHEEQFLTLCLRGVLDPSHLEEAAALAGRQPLDWDRVSQAARQNSLQALLYYKLRGKHILPQGVEESWSQAYYQTAAYNSLLLRELDSILRAFAAEGVPVLLLKGAAFVDALYQNPGVRPMVDLDLLVPRDQVERAERALQDVGFGMSTSDPWPGFSWRYRNSAAYGRPIAPEPSFYVGLHIRPYDIGYYERTPVADWFDRAVPVLRDGFAARMPAPEDHLVYLCGHQALHHLYGSSLLRLLDMALLIQGAAGGLDWDAVVRRTAAWRLVLPVRRTLAEIASIWPGLVPEAATAAVSQLTPTPGERRVQEWVLRHRTPTADTLLAVATMPGLGRRARFLFEAAFPNPEYMRRRYCPGRPGLWPLAYLQRAGLALRGLAQRLR